MTQRLGTPRHPHYEINTHQSREKKISAQLSCQVEVELPAEQPGYWNLEVHTTRESIKSSPVQTVGRVASRLPCSSSCDWSGGKIKQVTHCWLRACMYTRWIQPA
ncbi:hypothetical protein DAI22_01g049308 [Oryza sativa Japonica Group]|nr:hypothetical protein DAI22_01g049308 [Oryza sativa Japonica Group]